MQDLSEIIELNVLVSKFIVLPPVDAKATPDHDDNHILGLTSGQFREPGNLVSPGSVLFRLHFN